MKVIRFTETVYPYQTDAMQHVNNITYIEWMEKGRCQLLEAVGLPIETILKSGYGPVLTRTEIEYLQELRLGERVEIQLWIGKLGRASAVMEFAFERSSGETAATGRQTGVFIDLQTRRPLRFEPKIREAFARFLKYDSEPETG